MFLPHLFCRAALRFLPGLLLLTAAPAYAQAPSWQMASLISQSGSNSSTVMASATDAAGDVYVAGYFTGTASFSGTTLSSAGDNDLFVAKWSPSTSRFVWAQRAGGSSPDLGTALAVSGGSVYVAGNFAGQASFGSLSLSSAGSDDAFVAKLTDAGSFVWAQRMGGTGSENAPALAVAGTSVYVGGSFLGPTATFGSTVLTNAATPARNDGFVAKLLDAGASSSFAWAQLVGGSGDDMVMSMAATSNAVYAAGLYSNTLTLGSTTLQGGSMFLTRLTDNGSGSGFAWALSVTGPLAVPNAVALNGPNVYVAGRFIGTATFGATSFTNTSAAGAYDVFVTKATDAGTSAAFTWALQAAGPLTEYASGVAVSGTRVYVTGGYRGTVGFGSGSLSTPSFSDNVFVAGIADAGSTGSFAWAQSANSPSYGQARTLALGPGGQVYVAGSVTSPVTFGSVTPSTASTAQVGFLASFTEQLPTATAPAGWGAGVALYPNPAHRMLTLRLPAGARSAVLTLTDALGRVRHTQPLAAAESTLALPALPAGMYHLRVQAGTDHADRLLRIE